MSHDGEMSVNAHCELQTKKVKNFDFEVFTKMSSLSPRLAIPMLQIVIKHL